jgi:hypothetical protein
MPSAVGGASGATSSWLLGWDQSCGARLTAMAAAAASSSSILDSSLAEVASEAVLAASCALVADASSGVGRWDFLTGGAAHDDDDNGYRVHYCGRHGVLRQAWICPFCPAPGVVATLARALSHIAKFHGTN